MCKIKLLDCTFRDGGYYNLWDFSEKLINNYLFAMKEAKIDVVEIGFRSLKNDGFKGACAFTSDEFLRKLNIYKSLSVSVMVNASELLSNDDINTILAKIFPNDANSSPVDIVRVACHYNEFEKVLNASNWLKNKGFKVMFNLMQISDRTEIELENLLKKANNFPIDVFYFADSTGSIDNEKTIKIVELIKQNWTQSIGCHTHDNLGLALSNTKSAIQSGVEWVDSTVLGMGRGPGNTKTELLSIELSKENSNLSPLIDLIYQYFMPLQSTYSWGTNIFYYLAGKYGIHPTFIQEMLQDNRYQKNELISIVDRISKTGGKKFSREILQSARDLLNSNKKGSWKPETKFKEKDVLILGSGPGLNKYKSGIEEYIKTKKPIVLSLNIKENFNSNYIDYIVACHPFRILSDLRKYNKIKTPFIMPLSQLDEHKFISLDYENTFNFGLLTKKDHFEFNEMDCKIPVLDVWLYAIGIANSGKASKIFLAGFDGFDYEDSRFSETNEILEKYSQNKKNVKIISLTPTKYPIKTKSIFFI